MKLFINCSNLRFGGGKTVGINIINYFLQHTDYQISLVAPPGCGYEHFENTRINLKIIDAKYNTLWFKKALNSKYLPLWEKETKPDVSLSLGNIAFRSSTPQYLLIHQSHLVYPDLHFIKKLPFKQALYLKLMLLQISRNLKYADMIGLQTQTMLSRFRKLFPQYSHTCLTPNSISLSSLKSIMPLDTNHLPVSISLLFFSKLYPNKNFDILWPIATIIKEKKLPITITLTIEESESAAAKDFLKKIRENGFEDILQNKGHIDFHQIPALYEAHQGLLLPTLLESFSGTYIESMHFGRPIFTSNFDFATEICGDAAYYFDPFNAEAIVETILEAFKNPDTMFRKLEEGYKRSRSMKSWDEIGAELQNIIATKLYKSNN